MKNFCIAVAAMVEDRSDNLFAFKLMIWRRDIYVRVKQDNINCIFIIDKFIFDLIFYITNNFSFIIKFVY